MALDLFQGIRKGDKMLVSKDFIFFERNNYVFKTLSHAAFIIEAANKLGLKVEAWEGKHVVSDSDGRASLRPPPHR